MKYLIALDQGTSSSRSLVFSEHGDIIASQGEDYVATGSRHCAGKASRDSKIPLVADESEREGEILADESLNYLPRGVWRGVVNDDDFIGLECLAHGRPQGLQHVTLMLVGKNYDRGFHGLGGFDISTHGSSFIYAYKFRRNHAMRRGTKCPRVKEAGRRDAYMPTASASEPTCP